MEPPGGPGAGNFFVTRGLETLDLALDNGYIIWGRSREITLRLGIILILGLFLISITNYGFSTGLPRSPLLGDLGKAALNLIVY